MKTTRQIFLIEDDTVDVMTMKRVFHDLEIANPLLHFRNGEEALVYLQKNPNCIPFLFIVDLNTPRISGIEFLQIMKKDERFRLYPIIIITTSKEEADRKQAYQSGCAGYFIKSVEYNEFREDIKVLYSYWITCELPEDSCTEY